MEADPLALSCSISSNQGTPSDREYLRTPGGTHLLVHTRAPSRLASFLIQPRITSLGNGAAHSGLGTPTSVNKSRWSPTGRSNLDNSSAEALLTEDF